MPSFIKLQTGKRNQEANFELALIFPMDKRSKCIYVRDDIGRNIEAKLMSESSNSEDKKFRIKEIIPYWTEELIYDFDNKKRVPYDVIMKIILNVTDIAQIFTLNNKVFLQVEDNIRMFGNKNIADANRLFEAIKSDLIKKGLKNFIFVKDINSYQRHLLYEMLEEKGYKRTELFRHYSY